MRARLRTFWRSLVDALVSLLAPTEYVTDGDLYDQESRMMDRRDQVLYVWLTIVGYGLGLATLGGLLLLVYLGVTGT